MNSPDWFHALPLWSIFALTLVLCLAAVEVGAALAHFALRRKKEKEPEGPVGSLVGALSALLAFILGFTFALAAGRYETRKGLVLDEANAIGTTYLRAALLPEPQGREIRKLLREYAEIRANVTLENIEATLARSEQIHALLWAQTRALVRQDMDSEVRSLFISTLNELIDLHQTRKTVGLQRRIPGIVWAIVYLLTSLSMLGVGYQAGMSGARRLLGTPALAAAFSLVVLMIADIDRPGAGFMRVSQQPLADVLETMLRDSP